jgi:hypothetical protein
MNEKSITNNIKKPYYRTHFWIDGTTIYSCTAEHYKGGFWRVAGTEKAVRVCGSKEEAEIELKRLTNILWG